MEDKGNGQYSLETKLPAKVLFLFQSGQQIISTDDLKDAEFTAGLQFGGIFRIGSVWNSGEPTIVNIDEIRKASIIANPPPDGQIVLQFLLSLPQAREVIFSFSMGLQDGCSDGVFF